MLNSRVMDHIRRTRGTAWIALTVAGLLAACSEEPPPTSVFEFMENPILLEATMVRCVQNRSEARYDPECLNAREAVNRIAAREEAARRAELEAQSERKRQALRRAQEAAAEARRRALEEQRRREEAELLGPFAPQPEGTPESGPRPSEEESQAEPPREQPPSTEPAAEPPVQAPSTDQSPQPADSESLPVGDQPSDLEAIRQELERRQQDSPQDSR